MTTWLDTIMLCTNEKCQRIAPEGYIFCGTCAGKLHYRAGVLLQLSTHSIRNMVAKILNLQKEATT